MQQSMTRKNFIGAALAAGLCGRGMAASRASNGKRWYRGMLHMHTLWSDGRALPEQAVAAYKNAGYDARIGATVKLVEGKKGDRLEASYTLASDDLYVRARVESDAPTKFKRKRCLHPAHHTAWTQPYSLVES